MNEANEKQLFEKFPALYRDASSAEPSCMRNFYCGDGWFDLIFKLSEAIEQEAYRAGLKPSDAGWPRALQVKEKFATLRYYVSTVGDENHEDDESAGEMKLESAGGMLSFRPVASNTNIRKLVTEAEQKSAFICADCGQPGEVRHSSWMHVACDKCEAIKEAEYGRR